MCARACTFIYMRGECECVCVFMRVCVRIRTHSLPRVPVSRCLHSVYSNSSICISFSHQSHIKCGNACGFNAKFCNVTESSATHNEHLEPSIYTMLWKSHVQCFRLGHCRGKPSRSSSRESTAEANTAMVVRINCTHFSEIYITFCKAREFGIKSCKTSDFYGRIRKTVEFSLKIWSR